MIYTRDNYGFMKGLDTTSLIDFFVSPDNDLLAESSGAKDFLD
jgi:hypothetical protein